jgi:death-on-curing protein
MKYLSLKTVLAIHERSLEEYGGDPGVRDQGLLESAVAQPRARFGGSDLYPSLAEKAAALAFSLAKNHPFFDGNKRTGYGAMLVFLSRNGHTLDAPLDEHEATFLRLAAGTMSREEFLAWLRTVIVRKGASRSPGRSRPPDGRPDPPSGGAGG